MKKNRNAFFNENNANFQGYNPMGVNMPYVTSANSSFYAGNMPIMQNDFETRFAKIERQINRLEHRINNLEQKNVKTTDDYNDTSDNMYMI